MKILLLSIGLFSFFTHTWAQLGGESIYGFLNLPNSARVASLGGKQIAIKDNDPNLAANNPSLLNDQMRNHLALNYMSYYAGINWGLVSYTWHTKKLGNTAVGMNYLHYGEFTEANEEGVITGTFTAADYALNLIWSYPIDSFFTVGINLKPLYSSLERYNSLGLATDIGVTYHNEAKLFTAALVIRNLGTQITTYTDDNREPLPFEIQFGVSQKLEHAPFRFSLVAHHLERFDYTYESEDDDGVITSFSGETNNNSKFGDFADKALRHLVVGVEFIPTKSFLLRLGYDYQRRQEMQIQQKAALVGFSWGFGIKISKFHLNYGRANYHLAGATNHFSMTTNLSEFYR